MAAVTETSRRSYVFGSQRVVEAVLTIANTNTWDTKLHLIKTVTLVSPSTTAGGVSSISGGTVTFAAGGTLTGARVMAIGY